MDAEQVAEVLADHVSQRLIRSSIPARLAYVALDRTPRVVPVAFWFDGSDFVVCTAPETYKVRALRERPAVALTIDTERAPQNVLLVRGTAAVETVPGVPQVYLDASAKLVPEENWEAWLAGVRQTYDAMTIITIRPTFAKFIDFERRAPEFLENRIRASGADPS